MAHDNARLVRNLHVLSALSRRVLEEGVLESAGLRNVTFTQINILKMLEAREPRRAKEVAQFLTASKPAATQLLRRMERSRLIARRRSREDGRAEEIRLTPNGRRVLAAFDAEYRRRLRRLIGDVSDSRLAQISESMEAISSLLLRDRERVDGVCLHCGVYASPTCVMRQHGYTCPVDGGCG